MEGVVGIADILEYIRTCTSVIFRPLHESPPDLEATPGRGEGKARWCWNG